MQYLAHGVLHRGQLYRNSLVSLDGNEVVIRPFDGEGPRTIFVPGLVAVCSERRLTPGHRRALSFRVQDAQLLERAIIKASRYLTSNSLYLTDDPADTPILLLLPRK